MLLIEMRTLVAQLTVNYILFFVDLITILAYHVTQDGWRFIGNTDVGELYYYYKNNPQ